jgi:hypothetical protein
MSNHFSNPAASALARLQSPEASTLLAPLVTLAIDQIFETPLSSVTTSDALAHKLHQLLNAWVDSPSAQTTLERWTERVYHQLSSRNETVETVLPVELRRAIDALLSRPFSPDKRVVLQVIDQEPMRELVKQLLVDKRASAPVAGVAKSLGGLARMAQETLKSSSGSLGSIVGAVSGEVERQLERRAVEFVDGSLAQFFDRLANVVSSPARAHEAAELRRALFDGVLHLNFEQLGREWLNADVAGGARLLREALNRWLMGSGSERELRTLVSLFFEPSQHQTLRAFLSELGLLEPLRDWSLELLLPEATKLTQTPAFEAWFLSLFS